MAKKKKIKNRFKVLAFVEVYEISQGWITGGVDIPGTFDRTVYYLGQTTVDISIPFKIKRRNNPPLFTPEFLNLINYGPQWRADGTEYVSVRFTFTDINNGETITIISPPGYGQLQSTKIQTFKCIYA